MQWLGSRKSHGQVQSDWQTAPLPHAVPGRSHCSSLSTNPLPQCAQVPCVVGLTTLNCLAPLFFITPSANRMLYESPPVTLKNTHPPLPVFGGSTPIAAFLPLSTALN